VERKMITVDFSTSRKMPSKPVWIKPHLSFPYPHVILPFSTPFPYISPPCFPQCVDKISIQKNKNING